MAPIDLDSLLPLGRASRYPRAKDATAILPVTYGEFYTSLSVDPDDADGGFLPAVSIDTDNWVYLLNDGPVPGGPPPIIFANDTRQDPSVYTWSQAIDYQSTGHVISMIQFNVNPADRAISWRGYGTTDGFGTLITNPVHALGDVFVRFGGWTLDDYDAAASAQSKEDMQTLGDTIHWVFSEEKSYREWLQLILPHYFTDFYENSDGKLRVVLDRSVTTLPVYVLDDTLDADIHLMGAVGQNVEYEQDTQNLFNTSRVSWRKKWTTGKYTSVPTIADAKSVNIYGSMYRPFELPASYTEAEALRWWWGMITRYSYKPATLRFTVRGLSLLTALPGTFLGFIWRKQGWTQPRLIKVLEQTVDDMADPPQIRFVCFDCQRGVTDQVVLDTVPIVEERRRIAEGNVNVDITPPGAASNLVATGSYRRIVLTWMTPSDMDYDHTEIWAAVANNRGHSSFHFIRNGGYSKPKTTCQEAFDVGDAESSFVWLMTVDENGNGRNGGSGSSGGNWHPSSPTGGVFAQASLVNTPGIAQEAVTKVYPRIGSFLGTYIGEQILTTAFLSNVDPVGSILAWGNVTISVPTLCTAQFLIRESNVAGSVLGQAIYSNIFDVTVSPRILVPGAHFIPTFGIVYVLTAQVFSQAGVDTAYTASFADLLLWHTKR